MKRLLKIVVLGAATAALIVSGVLVAGAATTASPLAPARGIWLSQAEILALPTSGAAWDRVQSAADGPLGAADIANQDSDHDVLTLAAALAYARTGIDSYRAKAANAIMSAIETENGGRTLALGRNLVSYVIAADLINLAEYDAAKEQGFRSWLGAVRRERMSDGSTLVEIHEKRATNWGTMAGASRVAADAYLGDVGDLARAAEVFGGWLGDRSAYTGFGFPSASSTWAADPAAMVPVNPMGAVKDGHSVDGALIAEMARGGSFSWPPKATSYPWGGLSGAAVQAVLLERQGYLVCGWSDRAIVRAYQFLLDLQRQVGGGWWIDPDDKWQPWLVNSLCGSSFPTETPTRPGKNMGWSDWTHAGTVPPPTMTEPSATTEPPVTTEPPPTTTAPTCDQACVDGYEQRIATLRAELAQAIAERDAARADAASLQAQLDAWVAWYATAP